MIREVGDTANGARVDLAVRGLGDPRVNDHLRGGLLSLLLGDLEADLLDGRRSRLSLGRRLLGSLLSRLLSLLGGELGLLLSLLLGLGLLRLGSRLLLLRLGSSGLGGRLSGDLNDLLGLGRHVLGLELLIQLLVRSHLLLGGPVVLGERHRLLAIQRLARGREHVGAITLHGRLHRLGLALDVVRRPTLLVGDLQRVIDPRERLLQLRRELTLGHAALLLFGLLRSFHHDLGLLLGLGGRRRDDREKLLDGKLLDGLLDVLDAGHGLVVLAVLGCLV